MQINAGYDAYIEVDRGRILVWSNERYRDLVEQIPTAKWRENRRGKYWDLPASAASAESLASVMGDANVECDPDFMTLYEMSQQVEHARTLRDADDLPDHPSLQPSWLHQRRAFQFGRALQGFGFWADMGTGKSKVVVDLIANRGHRLVLIVAPLKATAIWPRQFRDFCIDPTVEVVVLGSKSKKMSIERRAQVIREKRSASADHPVVFVTNYQAFNSSASSPFVEAVMSTDWDMVVADEAHMLAGPRTRISDLFARFPAFVPYRMGLSGTPEKKGPLDVWGIYRFLDPSIFPASYYKFREQYAIMDPMFPGKVRAYHDLDDFARRMYSIAFRVTADVLDLPEYHHITRPVQLSTEAMRQHNAMRDDLIAHTDEGTAVADNVLTKFLRMQQITGGYLTVRMEDDTDVSSRIDFAKLDELQSILEETPNLPQEDPTAEPTPEPVVVFCRFRAELDDIRALCDSMGLRFGELSGRRDDLDSDGRMPEGIDVLGVQIQAGGTGIDLTRARYAVYYSLGYSWVDYQQSLKRLHRPGQFRPVVYYHLIATGTVDEHVYRAMQQKTDVIDYVWSQIGGE